MVVREVQAHAFKGMGAARLGMLDLLSSFEEVLKGKMLRDMVNFREIPDNEQRCKQQDLPKTSCISERNYT